MQTDLNLAESRRPARHLGAAALLLSICGLPACGGQVLGWPLDCVTCTDDTAVVDDTGTPVNVAPFVIWTNPDDVAINVATNTSVLATFSEPMEPLSITTTSFTLSDADGPVDGSVTRYAATAIFAPTATLAFDTEYTATITTGATDAAGLAMLAAHVWTFTTGQSEDHVAPRVTLTSPDDLAVDVALDANILASFSESMDPLTITDTSFTLQDELAGVLGIVVFDDASLTGSFYPDAPLLPGTTYTATITADATDLAGNPLVGDYVWTFSTGAVPSAWVPVDLGSLSTFVAVSGAGLTNSNSSGFTTLNGDVGLSPTATCLGDGSPCTATNPIINGTFYANDPEGVAAQAKTDLTAAYIDAMARPVGTIVNDLSGMVLAPGVYTSDSTMSIAVGGTLTLDAEGDANAVWIFQVGSSLTVNNNAQVLLVNGAQAKNVFWGVFASSTLGSNVGFQGSVLAGASNSVGTDSTVVGRLLCTTGQITLLSNTITLPPL